MKTLLRTALAALALLCTFPYRPAGADPADDYIKAQMAQRHIPGMTVSVVQDGRVLKAQGYGLASVELNAPATADTIYPLGSISKQFTAAAVMLLAHDGKLGLDDPIRNYLATLPPAWRAITVRQLLNQTSGIPQWNPDTDKDPLLKTYTLAEIAARAALKPLAFTPGAQYNYSNMNYNLLAGIIEKASGKPYDDFLQERLFRPLGMTATGLYDPQVVVLNRAAGYDGEDGEVYNNILFFDTSYTVGAGGLQSSVGDLVKWDVALAGGKVLPLSVMAQMWTPPTLPGGAKTDYGMGWISQTINGHRVVWHNGSIPGARAFLGRFPDDHLTVIVLTNLFPLGGDEVHLSLLPLGQGLAALYVPALAPSQPAPAQAKAARPH